jgi:hypothetical protein
VVLPDRGRPRRHLKIKNLIRMGISKKSFHRKAKAFHKEVFKKIEKELSSGPGFEADKELRYYLKEFNNRLFLDPKSMPSSYNVMSSFFQRHAREPRFSLLEEEDHIFGFSDFMDFATSDAAPPLASIENLPFSERRIYSYTSIDPIGDFLISTKGGLDFCIGSISIVADCKNIYILLVAGFDIEIANDLDLCSVSKSLSESCRVSNLKAKLGEDGPMGPVFFRGDRRLLKVNALASLDPKNFTFNCRYITQDFGNHFSVSTDDPIMLDSATESFREAHLDAIEEYSAIFDVMKYAVLLPSYFNYRIDVVIREPYRQVKNTQNPSIFQHPEPVASATELAQPNFKIRRVSAIRRISISSSIPARKFTPPNYKVPVSGFWRQLANDSVGSDENGRPVLGKTWVRAHERWRELPNRPKEVFLKSRIAAARRFAESQASIEEVHQSITLCEVKKPDRVSAEVAYEERKKLTSRLRFAVLSRDLFRCVKCGCDASQDNSIRLEVDHILPVSKGGKTTPQNLQTLCKRCNVGKTDLL